METKFNILEKVLILTDSGLIESEIIGISCDLDFEPTYRLNTSVEANKFRHESEIWRTKEEFIKYIEDRDIPKFRAYDDLPF